MIPLVIVISLFSIGTISILIDMIINPDINIITKPSTSIIQSDINEDDAYPIDDIFLSSIATEPSEKNSEEDNPLLFGLEESSAILYNDNFPFDLQISNIDSDLESISDSLPINDDQLIIGDDLDLDNELIMEKNNNDLNTINLDSVELDSIATNDLEDSLCAPIDLDKKLMDYDLIFEDDSLNKDLELE